MALRNLILYNGHVMPSLGLGTYLVVGEKLQKVVDYALDIGYRHIDTAYSYNNESDIGQVISNKLTQGKVKRQNLFLTTKVPFNPKELRLCAEMSLHRLKMDYVDMLLIHHPWNRCIQSNINGKLFYHGTGDVDTSQRDLLEAWQCMEDLVDDGLTKSIGLSNASPSHIESIWEKSRIKPANLQLECHIYHQQNVLRDLCRSKNIVVTGYSPLGAPGRPDRHRSHGDDVALDDPIICEIARKHDRSPAQILLCYLMQLGLVPLPKSETLHRIKENMSAFDVRLDSEDMLKIGALDRKQKYFRFLQDVNLPGFPKWEPF